jgi:putative acetyltransferase
MDNRENPRLEAGFKLVPRQPGDFEPITGLWVTSWRTVMPQIDFEARRPWFGKHLLATEGGGGQTVCAFADDDRLAGFILLVAHRAYLEHIVVHPHYFGRGLAAQLLDHAKALCPSGLKLDVNADNARALRFYEREGFLQIAAGRNPNSGLPTVKLHWPGK